MEKIQHLLLSFTYTFLFHLMQFYFFLFIFYMHMECICFGVHLSLRYMWNQRVDDSDFTFYLHGRQEDYKNPITGTF